MDKGPKTFIKHSFRVTTDYIAILFIFLIMSYPVVSLAGEDPGGTVRVVSFLLFLALFGLVYRDMQDIATRERRPQYEINPTQLRGFLLGLTGLVPIWILQGIIALLPLADNEVLHLRLMQASSVPFYWLASMFGGAFLLYPVFLGLTAFMAVCGYWAGLTDFFLMQRIYKLIGYTPKKRVRKVRRRTGKGFWGM